MSVLSGVEKTGEPVASQGMFQTHGGLFILKAIKIHLKPRGGRNLQGDTPKRSGIHKPILQEGHVTSAKSLSGDSVDLAAGSSYKEVSASNTGILSKSSLTILHNVLSSLSLFQII